VVDSYTAEQLPPRTQGTDIPGGEAQSFLVGQDVPRDWWTLLGSPKLNALMVEAMSNYPDIAAQQAALRAARANAAAQAGVFLPSGSAEATSSRQKTPGQVGKGLITDVYQANVNVSYTLDLFGGERRALEGLQAQARASRFALEASYLTLTANVAAAAIQIGSLQDQVGATREIIGLEARQLAIAERRFQLGSATQADVLQQQSNLASVRATLPQLQQQLAAAQHQLAVLTGRLPQNAPPIEFHLAELTLPRDLPLSLPSFLVAQRPDIRQQAEIVHQASAAIGVATANMLPQITLTGSYGNEWLHVAHLSTAAIPIWGAAAGITQPLFAGGALRAKRRAAVAAYDQACAQYQLTVLQAFQNVADTLTALANDALAVNAQQSALQAARSSLELIQRQYAVGAIDHVTLLTAEQTYQQASLALVRALANRFTDTVTLFQALGGGRWNRQELQSY